MESDMRKKEAEESAIAEIAESSGGGAGKGINNQHAILAIGQEFKSNSTGQNFDTFNEIYRS